MERLIGRLHRTLYHLKPSIMVIINLTPLIYGNMFIYTLRKQHRRVVFIVQELYDFSRNKLQQKVSQRVLVNRGVLYNIPKV